MADLVPEEGGAVEDKLVDFGRRRGDCGQGGVGAELRETGAGEEGPWRGKGVCFLDLGEEDSPLEVGNLLAGIDLAEVAEVVQAFVSLRCGFHGLDVEPAFPSPAFARARTSIRLSGEPQCYSVVAACGAKGRLGEEVSVAPFPAREACGEIGGGRGTPSEDSDVGGEEPVEDVWVLDLVVDGVEGEGGVEGIVL